MTEVKVESTTSDDSSPQSCKTYKLEIEQELRFEVVGKEKVIIELTSGLAELFGTELIKGKKYEFYGCTKGAVFTWHGCSIDVTGICDTIYVGGDTPMTYYVNVHGALEVIRSKAKEDDTRGPFVLIVGPQDTGKSTVSRILCNYAVRRGRCPLLIDLNVASNIIGIPGTIGVNVVERPSDLEEKTLPMIPAIFHYGSVSPGDNVSLYNTLISKIADSVRKKVDGDKMVKSSGAIINTCSWVTESGYSTIIHIAKEFEVDVIIVLDMPKLCNDLSKDLPSNVKVIPAPKSNGVVRRSLADREEMREDRICRYFYGRSKWSNIRKFFPHIFTIPFNNLKIYKPGTLSLPASCLPIGMEQNTEQVKFVPMTPTIALQRHILAVSWATNNADALAFNVMGFICVTQVDLNKQLIKILSPQPAPLPVDKILLYSELQYADTD